MRALFAAAAAPLVTVFAGSSINDRIAQAGVPGLPRNVHGNPARYSATALISSSVRRPAPTAFDVLMQKVILHWHG